MGEQSLWNLPLGETLVAALSQVLDSGGVPNVLWGNYLLTVYGIPSLTNVCQKPMSSAVDNEANILSRTLHSRCLMIWFSKPRIYFGTRD